MFKITRQKRSGSQIMRYYFIAIRMTIIKENKSVGKNVDKLETFTLLWECKMLKSLKKMV